jgi:hypothetical protein
MNRAHVLSGPNAIALDNSPTAQGNSIDCKKERSQSSEAHDQFQAFDRLRDGFGRLGWCLYALGDGSAVASCAARGLLSPCPDNRAAASLLRMLGG